jgi:hypothetical protein
MSEYNGAVIADNRIAVEFLTMWMQQDELTASSHVYAVLNDQNWPGVPSIIAGQLNVGQALVVWLAQAYGAETEDEIRRMSGYILQVLASEVTQ